MGMRNDGWYDNSYKFILLIFDLLLLNIVFYLSYAIRFEFDPLPDQYIMLLVVFNLSWIASALYNNIYDIDGHTKFSEIIIKIIFTITLHLFFILAFIVSVKAYEYSRIFIFTTYLSSILLVIAFRLTSIKLYKYYKNVGENYKKVVVIGARKNAQSLIRFFETKKDLGYKFMGFFDDTPDLTVYSKDLILGEVKDIKEYANLNRIDEIYYTLPLNYSELIREISEFADEKFISFKISPDFKGLVNTNVNLYFYDGIPVLAIRREPLSILFNRIIKRAFDIAFSLGVILILFPFIFPIIALAIKLDSKGPIFFKQLRPGKKNRLFYCYKFRTMKVNNNTELQAQKNDPRVTRVGAILRKTSLDELPQFFNVLLGDMSVVGPRPNLINQLDKYSKLIDKYAVRHFVLPGITGYAQVNGYRGETKDVELMAKRVEYDVRYMENWSFALDIRIILKTVWNVVRGERNAY
jgi:putative colanic acid biosysnthesis UDP-glucose lipid carrier transferase